MSLKDDFLEALRSVKKDFFKDYEYTQADSADNSPRQHQDTSASPQPARQDFADTEPVVPSVHAQIKQEDPRPAVEDDASPSPQWGGQLHSAADQPYDDSTVELVEPKPAPTQAKASDASGDFSDFLPRDNSPLDNTNSFLGDADSGGLIPPTDGRVIYDDFGGDDTGGIDKTIISKNTIIRGALQTEDSVRMYGQVMGDIDCKSNILVAGKVRGNTSAANAYIIDAQVDGNLLCDDVVNVNDDAWILGNIRAQQAEIDGKVKGNIEIRHTISIGSNSSVIGNISTDELEIKRGAFINGQIMMYSPSRDVIDRFDQFER